MKEKKYKPVTFVEGTVGYYRDNVYQQNLLLKAMQVTNNPIELKKAIGVRAVADVIRTLDKLTIRKEYHKALANKGFSLDYIVNGVKNIAENGDSDTIKLKALQTVLRSIGLERYEDIEDHGKGWEEMLVEMQEKGGGGDIPRAEEPIDADYEVNVPVRHLAEEKKRLGEADLGKQLYAI
jgi:hypothetical protein